MPDIDFESCGQIHVVDALRAERRDFQVPRADVFLVMEAAWHGAVPVLAPVVPDLAREGVGRRIHDKNLAKISGSSRPNSGLRDSFRTGTKYIKLCDMVKPR